MKPHLDSGSNFNGYQHRGATVTVDGSFVKNGKIQDARVAVWGGGEEEVKIRFEGKEENDC